PDVWIECEHVDAVASGIAHHRAAAVDDIPRGDLLVPRLEDVIHHVLALDVLATLQDGKDRPDGDGGVNIARAVQRIKKHNVLGPVVWLFDDSRFVILLRDHDAYVV